MPDAAETTSPAKLTIVWILGLTLDCEMIDAVNTIEQEDDADAASDAEVQRDDMDR
jgi:hypothetical protein